MDFYNHTGKMALGSRLRRLSEKVTEDARQVYNMYHIDIEPKWFPVIYVLGEMKQSTVTEVAEIIGHSHPSVRNSEWLSTVMLTTPYVPKELTCECITSALVTP